MTEKHIDVNVRPKPPAEGDGGMAGVLWGSPSMEKTEGKSQSPSTPCRYPIPGRVSAPAPSTPTQPLLFPRGHVRVLPAFPITQCLPAIYHCLAGAVGGREGKGCFCLLRCAAAGYRSAPPPLPPASASPKEPGAGSRPEREDPRGDAPDPGSVFTDSQNSLRNKL